MNLKIWPLLSVLKRPPGVAPSVLGGQRSQRWGQWPRIKGPPCPQLMESWRAGVSARQALSSGHDLSSAPHSCLSLEHKSLLSGELGEWAQTILSSLCRERNLFDLEGGFVSVSQGSGGREEGPSSDFEN